MYIILAILLFSLLIFVHELGHFVTAKLSGVQVNEFSMFMGPAIYQKQVGETLYAIRCIPFGGYCAMEGEDEDSDNPRAFTRAAWWKKLIILVAGAAMNFLMGYGMFCGLYGLTPGYANIPQPVIGGFYEGNAIEGEDGLQVGDRLYKIDGERVYTTSNISLLLSMNLGNGTSHDIVVIRDGQQVTLEDFPMELRPVQTESGTEMLYGMLLTSKPRTLGGTLAYAWDNTIDTVRSVRMSLQMLFDGRASVSDLSGPVGVVNLMSDVASASPTVTAGLLNLVYLGAYIAVNLGVMNLLPIPALDGGRAVGVLITAGVEAVTKKKLNPKYEGYLHMAGMILLLALMALVSFKDIFTIFRG